MTAPPTVGDGARRARGDGVGQLAGRGLRPLQRRRVGVGHGGRVQRRVHVARVDRQEAHPLRRQLGVPDAAQVAQGRLARAVRAPARVGVDRRVAGDVQHDRAAALAGRRGQRPEQRLGQAERPEQVRGEGPFQVLAVGVAQQRQRRRPEVRGVVDQHVEPAELADDLHGDGVDVVLHGDVADDAVRAGVSPRHLLDAARRAGDEGHPRAAAEQLPDEGQAQPGGAAGDGDPQAGEAVGSVE